MAKKKMSKKEEDERLGAMMKAKEMGLSEDAWNELLRVIMETKSSDLSEGKWNETKKIFKQLGLSDEGIEDIKAILLSRCSSEGG